MSFSPSRLRQEFPLLATQAPPLHYLDNAATAQMHARVFEALRQHDLTARGNVQRGNHHLAEAATAAYELARERVARFLNAASADEVVFTAGTTAAINLVAGSLREVLRPGDEIVVSLAEHHSNFVPWQRLCQHTGAVLRALTLTADGRIDLDSLATTVGPRCRLIAVTQASNVTGAITALTPVVAAARRVGAQVLVDGAQGAPHGPVDVQALDIDFYAFSGHKCYGPTGIGALWGRAAALAALPPFMSGGGMVGEVTLEATTYAAPPRRFEAGTPPIAQAVGLGVALEWLQGLPWAAIDAHTRALGEQVLAGFAAIPGLRLLGPATLDARLPVFSFEIAGIHAHDICQVLDSHGVALRGGHHCAQPLMGHFGVAASARASLAPYNDAADVEALLAGLRHAVALLT